MPQVLLNIADPQRLPVWESLLPTDIDRVAVQHLAQAVEHVRAGRPLAAAVVELAPGDEHWLEALRELDPLLPVLVALRAPVPQTINRVHALRCEMVCGLPTAPQVEDFLQRACRAGRLSSRAVSDWIDRLIARRQLRPLDLELIPVVLGDETREQVRDRLGLRPEQMTRRMRALCRRCGARTPVGAARNLLRDALLNEQGAPSVPRRQAQPGSSSFAAA